jgi:hypothetical protein
MSYLMNEMSSVSGVVFVDVRFRCVQAVCVSFQERFVSTSLRSVL